jgi:Pyruvate/2-oxoacid:ferredoxin oxidoreductase delta subunit
MKNLQDIGSALVLLVLFAFLALPFLNKYEVDGAAIEAFPQYLYHPVHAELLQPELQDLQGKEYSKFELISALDAIIAEVNPQLEGRGDEGVWPIQGAAVKDYRFWLLNLSGNGFVSSNKQLIFSLLLSLLLIGSSLVIIPIFKSGTPGIKNNGIYHSKLYSRGWSGILMGILMITFYILLYFVPYLIPEMVMIFDPLAKVFGSDHASYWFMYGSLYTIAVLVMGVRMFAKYRHSNYQLIRTASVMFFQLALAFVIPEIMAAIGNPYINLHVAWPLDPDMFHKDSINSYAGQGNLFLGGFHVGTLMLFWSIFLSLVLIPLFTYLYGKRWYCSWVCGCGGLAETLGDPFRQQSDKSLKAWKIERYLIHGVLVFVSIATIFYLVEYFTGALGGISYQIKSIYGFAIGSIFAGVVGTGFYPLMGNRVWCRFGCPLAAIMGIVQRFKSRFRITTNGGQCMSCGNCSTYCEQGIDVRWYAQRGQDVVRASCVGCGVCSAVCPRGVLSLENGPDDSRVMDKPIEITGSGARFHEFK